MVTNTNHLYMCTFFRTFAGELYRGEVMDVSLKIQDFGPITNGYDDNDGYMPLKKMVVFCGTQGTGKSTVAKLYSTFIWLEKALVRGDFPIQYVELYNRFVKKFLAYQGINTYIKSNTSLHFRGTAFDFLYESGKFKATPHRNFQTYERPQIMYYPAERNLISIIEKASGIKGMPPTLETMLSDYNIACRSLTQDIQLPINGVRFHYDKLNKFASVIGKGYKVRMNEASSGIQSLTPLFITMNYLNETISKDFEDKYTRVSLEEKNRIDKRITELLKDDSIDDEVRTVLIKKLSDNKKNARLISIVEEPEQNLFPDSQESILHTMLRLSTNSNNQLLMTTHSPYILNYLMLAIKAQQIESFTTHIEDKQKLDSIVPPLSRIAGNDVVVYQLTLDGTIHILPTYDDMPSDENLLNLLLQQVNTKYSDLIEIQSRYE